MAKKRKTKGTPMSEEKLKKHLEGIAARLGARRTRQIVDTVLKLIKLNVPKEAVTICVNHIVGVACGDSAAESSPVEQRIAELREQLDDLNSLEDEGVRFRIQQEIQDLERTLAVEEWPEIIGAEEVELG